ncbi:hypothetical protein SESBI_05833 [Sesbania bispinosa]|nr:hypothetical protein SESBI_05833 [Sesbania bispinosa]
MSTKKAKVVDSQGTMVADSQDTASSEEEDINIREGSEKEFFYNNHWRWHPKLFPHKDELQRVAVWVRIPGLPIEYYDRHILWRIGSSLGHILKINSNTIRQTPICLETMNFELRERSLLGYVLRLNLRKYGHCKDECKLVPRDKHVETNAEEVNGGNPMEEE